LIIGRIAARKPFRNRRAGTGATIANRRIRLGDKGLAISSSETGEASQYRAIINFMTVAAESRAFDQLTRWIG
jgi:hypothetical protein